PPPLSALVPCTTLFRSIRLAIQRKNPEVVLVLTMALGRHGAAVAGLAEVGRTIGVVLAPFGQRSDVSRNVVVHPVHEAVGAIGRDRKSTRLNSSHVKIS